MTEQTRTSSRPSPDLAILETRVYRGANVWSYDKSIHLVVDLGSLAAHGEKATAAESVLAALWRSRAAREPVLIVIDEAHNVCPREPGDEVTALEKSCGGRIVFTVDPTLPNGAFAVAEGPG